MPKWVFAVEVDLEESPVNAGDAQLICIDIERPVEDALDGAVICMHPAEGIFRGLQTTPEPKPFEEEAWALYAEMTNNADIHSNRFPSWGELSQEAKAEWFAKAEAA
jgi:hypothetical protein